MKGCPGSQQYMFVDTSVKVALFQCHISSGQSWYQLLQGEGDLNQQSRSWTKTKESKVVQYVFSCRFGQSSLSRCFVSPTAVKELAGNSCPVAPCSTCLSEGVLAEDA